MLDRFDFLALIVFVLIPLAAVLIALVLIFIPKVRPRIPITTVAAVVGVYLLVIAVIVLFFFPPRMEVESARRAACMNNIRQISMAMSMYAADSNDTFLAPLVDDAEPAQRRFSRLLKASYLNAPKIFHCPSSRFDALPQSTKLDGPSLTDSSLKSIADLYCDNDWCSYGLDPRLKYSDPKSRAILADRPDPAFWGTGVNSPPAGKPGSNSANHHGAGQNVVYRDGHVKWMPTCADDSALDPNIYSSNPEIDPAIDSNIDFGPPRERLP